MGNWYIDLGQYEQGMKQFEEAKEAMEHAGARSSAEYARLLRNMGKSLIVQGKQALGGDGINDNDNNDNML